MSRRRPRPDILTCRNPRQRRHSTLHCGEHSCFLSTSVEDSNTRSFERALASRDMTVPIGQRRMLAISWYDRSSYSRNTIISRDSSGSWRIAPRTMSHSTFFAYSECGSLAFPCALMAESMSRATISGAPRALRSWLSQTFLRIVNSQPFRWLSSFKRSLAASARRQVS